MAATAPFDVAFPVNFYSGGDTTKEAFGKHIQEIKRIYGIINAVNADKLSATEFAEKFGLVDELKGDVEGFNLALSNHIQSASPHPNYKPDLANTTGKLDASRLTGQLPIKVVKEGTFVTPDPDVTVIEVPNGIDYAVLENNGYAKFSNGLMIPWGRCFVTVTADNTEIRTETFPHAFSSACFNVSLTVGLNDDANATDNAFVQLVHTKLKKESFGYFLQFAESVGVYTGPVSIFYIAIGV